MRDIADGCFCTSMTKPFLLEANTLHVFPSFTKPFGEFKWWLFILNPERQMSGSGFEVGVEAVSSPGIGMKVV